MAAKKKSSKPKWIQAAREKMVKKGTVGSYGHHSVKQMEKDKAKGGKISKKANFALNMEKIHAKKQRTKKAH